MFQGEPGWLVLVVTVVILAGIFVILEKVLRLGVWLLIAGVVAALVIFVGVVFVPGCGVEETGEPVEVVEEEEPEAVDAPEEKEEGEVGQGENLAPFQTPPLVPR